MYICMLEIDIYLGQIFESKDDDDDHYKFSREIVKLRYI